MVFSHSTLKVTRDVQFNVRDIEVYKTHKNNIFNKGIMLIKDYGLPKVMGRDEDNSVFYLTLQPNPVIVFPCLKTPWRVLQGWGNYGEGGLMLTGVYSRGNEACTR